MAMNEVIQMQAIADKAVTDTNKVMDRIVEKGYATTNAERLAFTTAATTYLSAYLRMSALSGYLLSL